MNAPLPLSPFVLDETLLKEARLRAHGAACSTVIALQSLVPIDARQLTLVIGAYFSMPVFDTAEMSAQRPRFDLLPLSKAMQRHSVILEGTDQRLFAVISDPFDQDLITWMSFRTGAAFDFVIALGADIQAYLSKQEESVRAVDQLAVDNKPAQQKKKSAASLTFASVNEAASPTVKLVNSTLYDALKSQASDIHLESTPSGMTIKYRIDGVLDHAASIPGIDAAEQVISRLKVLAELDIAERRVPQDGSFRVDAAGRDIDLRVSIMPSIHGEDAVIRILDKRAMIEAYGALTLEALGFDAPSLVTLRTLAEEPYGMLLVTGPTGSGKTTTLYAALTEIHNGRDKIITIEDPVEYQLPGILQIPVNEKKGLTFAKGLRSILRHDPDKIMVGEIRDRETAEIAVQSALTGHLVLTTVHANNVFDVFGRFSHMGIDPYAFVSALNGIWAQRLVRLNCPQCARPYQPTAADLARVGCTPEQVSHYHFRRGDGCGDCRGTGYKGRHAVAEILILTDTLREMIVDKRPISQIKEVARANGTRTLREAAMELVEAGHTTIDEIKRVTLHA
jgi:general secretion pathway protein E